MTQIQNGTGGNALPCSDSTPRHKSRSSHGYHWEINPGMWRNQVCHPPSSRGDHNHGRHHTLATQVESTGVHLLLEGDRDSTAGALYSRTT